MGKISFNKQSMVYQNTGVFSTKIYYRDILKYMLVTKDKFLTPELRSSIAKGVLTVGRDLNDIVLVFWYKDKSLLDRVEVDDIMLKNLFGEMLIIAKQTMWNKSYKQRLDLYRRYSEELTIEDLKVIWVMHPKMLTEDARILLSQREDNKDFLEVLWEGIKPRKLVNSYKNIIKRRLERLEMLITNSNSVGHSQKINVKRYYDSESETTKLVMLIQRAVVASRLKMSSILYSCIERLRIVYPEKSSSIDKLIEDYLVFMDKLDKDFNMLSEEDFEDIKNFIHRIAAFINPEDCGKLLRQEI